MVLFLWLDVITGPQGQELNFNVKYDFIIYATHLSTILPRLCVILGWIIYFWCWFSANKNRKSVIPLFGMIFNGE